MYDPQCQYESVMNAIMEAIKIDVLFVMGQALRMPTIVRNVRSWRKIGMGARRLLILGQSGWINFIKGKSMDLARNQLDLIYQKGRRGCVFDSQFNLFGFYIIQLLIQMTQKPKNVAEDKQKLKGAKAKLEQMVYQSKKRILEGDLEAAYEELYAFISQEKQKLGGDDSVLLLPGLFTLAEIEIMRNQTSFKKAQEYLNAAHWSFLKSNDKLANDKKKQKGIVLTPEQQLTTKVNLHRTFAKLYQAKGQHKEAINQLKQAIYLQSTKWGPEYPYVASSYFLMGKVFIDWGNQSIGQAFYAKVAEIWYRYLKNYFQLAPEQQQAFLIDQLNLEQAINYLSVIEKHFEQAYDEEQAGVVFTPVMRTFYAIGLLYKIFGDDSQCEGYLKQVYRKCLRYLPEDDKKTSRIKSMLVGMNVDLKDAELEEQDGGRGRAEDQLMQAGEEGSEDDR